MENIEKRQANERKIVRKMIREAKKIGFEVYGVDDGGDVLEKVSSEKEAMEAIFAVDEARLAFRGWFNDRAVYHVALLILDNGNMGADVIADYGYAEGDPDGFDAMMNRVCDYAQQFEEA